jgi:CheY-like chemotaxis protein
VNQKVLASFLTKYHVPFSMANNGLEAFQMVKEKPFGFFSLILLDLAMPIWDGYRVRLFFYFFYLLYLIYFSSIFITNVV